MEPIKHLLRSAIAMLLSILVIGGGIAIAIVAVARGTSEHHTLAAFASLALVLFGGYLMILATPFHANIRISSNLAKVSFEFKQSDEAAPAEAGNEKPPTLSQAPSQTPKAQADISLLARVFGVLALICISIVCIGGGIAVVIVATVRNEGASLPYAILFSGVVQTIFGGYLSTLGLSTKPWIKASGDLKGGLSLELKK